MKCKLQPLSTALPHKILVLPPRKAIAYQDTKAEDQAKEGHTSGRRWSKHSQDCRPIISVHGIEQRPKKFDTIGLGLGHFGLATVLSYESCDHIRHCALRPLLYHSFLELHQGCGRGDLHSVAKQGVARIREFGH